jgi:hypothetical protein
MAGYRSEDHNSCDQECENPTCCKRSEQSGGYDTQAVPNLPAKAIARITEAIKRLPENNMPSITRQEAIALLGSAATETSATAPAPLSRVLCAELVELQWKGIDGCKEHCTANLEELWRTGATLDLEQPLPDGAWLRISHPKADFRARLLYCQPNLTGYSAGVVFDSSTPWEPSTFLPEHCLPLLVARCRDSEEIRIAMAATERNRNRNTESRQTTSRQTTSRKTTSRKTTSRKTTARQTTAPRIGPGKQITADSLSPLISRGSLVRLGDFLTHETGEK